MQANENMYRSAVVIVALSSLGGCAAAQPEIAATPAGAQLKAAGREASLTVYPAGLLGRPTRQVGDAVALLLERAGMTKLEIDAPEFSPPEKADLTQTAAALAEFVRANPPATDYALFVDFLGSHEKGLEEVRAVIVNRQGEIVLQDRQAAGDADFKRAAPKDPMGCCVLAVQRLRPVLGLADPLRQGATEGKIARSWADRSGTPDKAEQDAMRGRQEAFKKAAGSATLRVYPARTGEEFTAESAAHLSQLINEAGLTKASAADQGPQPEIKGSMNEQKVLWQMARGVREYVKAHRPDADYVLFADYLLGTDARGKAGAAGVHFVVCDRDGRWVIVDYQNDHHADFRAIDPTTPAECDRLVARRLQGYCK